MPSFTAYFPPFSSLVPSQLLAAAMVPSVDKHGNPVDLPRPAAATATGAAGHSGQDGSGVRGIMFDIDIQKVRFCAAMRQCDQTLASITVTSIRTL